MNTQITMKGLLLCISIVFVVSFCIAKADPPRFPGCKDSFCVLGDYAGFDCVDGVCEKICGPLGCVNQPSPKEAILEQEDYGMTSQSRSPNFPGCQEDICKRDKLEGYDCTNGHCNYVCKGDTCYVDAWANVKTNEVLK